MEQHPLDLAGRRSADTSKTTSLSEIRDLGTLPIWHGSKPSAAGVLGCSRGLAYEMARRGDLPTLRLGPNRLVVPVPALLAMLGERS